LDFSFRFGCSIAVTKKVVGVFCAFFVLKQNFIQIAPSTTKVKDTSNDFYVNMNGR
jgi:hypothetical protein